jgi:CubicO group peptidase (beta-lactamase class C family)
VLRPAGADLRMNVADWSTFVRVHLGGAINGMRLIKPETLARLQLPVVFSTVEPSAGYAMGWGVFAAELIGLDPRYGRVLNHLGSDGVWLAEVDALPDIGFSIQIMANGTVDKNGNSLDSGAFEEIKLRLFHRFAPKLDKALQVTSQSATSPRTILAAPPVAQRAVRSCSADSNFERIESHDRVLDTR